MTDAGRRALDDFRAALRELAATDPERARLYLEGAALALRSWAKNLREHPPRPRGQREEGPR